MSPEAHDTAFAAVSHLPHLLAFAMMNGVLAQPEAADFLSLAGPGFRDFTRIAAATPLWRDVLLANREEVLAQSRHFQQALQQLEQAMLADDDQALQALLTRASDARLHWTMGQPRRPARRPDCIFDNSSCMYRTAFLDLPALATAGGTVSLPGSKASPTACCCWPR
jgi:hypothetical protein